MDKHFICKALVITQVRGAQASERLTLAYYAPEKFSLRSLLSEAKEHAEAVLSAVSTAIEEEERARVTHDLRAAE